MIIIIIIITKLVSGEAFRWFMTTKSGSQINFTEKVYLFEIELILCEAGSFPKKESYNLIKSYYSLIKFHYL